MTTWILAALALFFVQTLLAPSFRWFLNDRPHLKAALGPRDNPPPMPRIGGRLDRARQNMTEAMIVFLPLALLVEINGDVSGLAHSGAALFVIARVVYVPAYVSGIPGLRSLIWMIGHGGLIMMAVDLSSPLLSRA